MWFYGALPFISNNLCIRHIFMVKALYREKEKIDGKKREMKEIERGDLYDT